jgi:hypothetical protein
MSRRSPGFSGQDVPSMPRSVVARRSTTSLWQNRLSGNNEKDDLSADEKKQLRQLAERLKREAIATDERWQRENE